MFITNFTSFRSLCNLLGLILGYTILSVPSVFAFKMGLIDGQVIMNMPEINIAGKQRQVLNKYYPKLLELQKEYTTLESEFTKNEVLMDETTRKEKQAKLIKIAQSMNALKQKVEMESLQIEHETTQKLSDISTKIAKKYDFDVILTTPMNGGYVAKEVDMTKEALKMIRQKTISA